MQKGNQGLLTDKRKVTFFPAVKAKKLLATVSRQVFLQTNVHVLLSSPIKTKKKKKEKEMKGVKGY